MSGTSGSRPASGASHADEGQVVTDTKYLHIETRRQVYEDGKHKTLTEFVTFVVPTDSRTKYEPNQATLLVIDPSGDHIAGWRNVHEFRRDDIEKCDD